MPYFYREWKVAGVRMQNRCMNCCNPRFSCARLRPLEARGWEVECKSCVVASSLYVTNPSPSHLVKCSVNEQVVAVGDSRSYMKVR